MKFTSLVVFALLATFAVAVLAKPPTPPLLPSRWTASASGYYIYRANGTVALSISSTISADYVGGTERIDTVVTMPDSTPGYQVEWIYENGTAYVGSVSAYSDSAMCGPIDMPPSFLAWSPSFLKQCVYGGADIQAGELLYAWGCNFSEGVYLGVWTSPATGLPVKEIVAFDDPSIPYSEVVMSFTDVTAVNSFPSGLFTPPAAWDCGNEARAPRNNHRRAFSDIVAE